MKVSIIVPVYNVEQYLRKCLDSLVNQTYKNIEIIVINDGTKDNSQDIIDEYKENYPDLIKSYIKENGGLASARNFGLKKSKGDYIVFVDSDDYVDITMIEKLCNEVKRTNSDIVVCGANSVMNNTISELSNFIQYSLNNKKNYIINCVGACWQIIKRDLFIKNKLFFLENHFYEDIAIIPVLAIFANKISYIHDNLYYYLTRSGSIMNQIKYSKSLEDIFDSMETLRKKFLEMNMYNEYYEELEFLYIEHLLHAASLRFFKFDLNIVKENLNKIVKIIKFSFPNWKKNKYFKKQSLKYKIVCDLFYKKNYKLLKLLLKG